MKKKRSVYFIVVLTFPFLGLAQDTEVCSSDINNLIKKVSIKLDTEVTRPNGDIQTHAFIEDELLAIESLRAFSPQADSTAKYTLPYKITQMHCSQDKDTNASLPSMLTAYKKHKCNELTLTHYYIKSLIYALHDYTWHIKTKQLAKEKIKSYLEYIATYETSIASIKSAIVILKTYARSDETIKKIQKKISKLDKKFNRKTAKHLRNKVNATSCTLSQKIEKKELQLIHIFQKDLHHMIQELQ
ncbi:MAG: hypothetical protein KDK51_05135 [Deltaproteobacteria bacterium]|nr:hypothetical protein [Deltaproteobacteria bacterium]